VTTALLSPRFTDDGRPYVQLGADAREAVADVGDALRRRPSATLAVRERCPLCGSEAATMIAA